MVVHVGDISKVFWSINVKDMDSSDSNVLARNLAHVSILKVDTGDVRLV